MRNTFGIVAFVVLSQVTSIAPATAKDELAEAAAAGVPSAPGGARGVREGESSTIPDAITTGSNAREIAVRSGVNQIVPIAINHINRIVTPFVSVDVQTADPTDFKVSGSVIYLAPSTDRAITYYLTETGDQSRAISLTLVPVHIPPVEINLVIKDGGAGVGRAVGPSASDRPGAPAPGLVQPYVDEIRDLLRGLALGEIPNGYQMGAIAGRFPYCDPELGFRVDFSNGQYFVGRDFEAIVGVVRREPGHNSAEFREIWCGRSPGVAAVGVWPSVVLSGGEEAEIYVVKRVSDPKAGEERPRTARPSLVGGAR